MDKNILFNNINKIHTTQLGEKRIIQNLKLTEWNVVKYCKTKILSQNTSIYKRWKNYYCSDKNIIITINAYSYTIITAHIIQ